MIYQNYNLNLIPDQVPLSVWCSQYDKDSRTFRFTIYKGGELFFIPSGSTVSVRGTKSDNTGFEYPCTFDGTVVEVIVKDQMTIFAGKVPCEIRIANGSDIIGTANFNLMVERTPLDTDVTISETDLPLLEEAEQNAIRAEAAASQATTVLASAVKSVNNVLPDSNGNVTIQAGAGLPSGGTTGQYLVKSSATEGDADWQTKEVELTQAQYDALPSSKLTDGVSYYITDGESAPSTNRFSADGISYGSGSVADALDSLNEVLTGSDVATTSHTLSYAKAIKVGKLFVANLTFTVGSAVTAWTTLLTLNNVSIGASNYFPAYTGGTSFVMLYVGTGGQVSCISNLTANTEVKVTISLVLN